MLFQIKAIIFGAGEGITDIKLQHGVSIIKCNIYDKELSDFFDECRFSMYRNNIGAINIIDNTVYCINAEFDINDEEYEAERTECEIVGIVDKQIRLLRLYLGRYIYTKEYRYECKECGICGTIPSPDFQTEDVINTNVDIDKNYEISKILEEDIPLKNKWIYNVFLVYEKSFSKDIEISFITIVTALEMIFVDGDNAIKEKLSKRIAVYLSDDDKEKNEIYTYIRKLYKKRSSFVHDGENDNIETQEIWYMRGIVRQVILQFMNTIKTKKEFCAELVTKVKNTDNFIELNK